MEENTTGVKLKKLHFVMIEAENEKLAFSIFKDKLENRNVFVTEYDTLQFAGAVVRHGRDRHLIVKDFITSTGLIEEPLVWGGLYSEAKDNTLIKKFTEKNVTQNGTKKWETRYVLIGDKTGKRIDVLQTTKGDAVNLAKDLVLVHKENVSIQVEKVLTSHDPTVSTIEYIKDETEHANIYMFMCNVLEFDEQSINDMYEENVELDPDTKQWKIKVDTVFEYDKKITV